jgi:putative addiction module antidote
MVELKVVRIGNSLGVRLPREVLSRMHVADGDKLVLTEAPEGGYRISPYDPEFERQMELAEEGIRHYRNTLKALAE